MDKIEIVKSFYRACEKTEFDRIEGMLSEDFYFDRAVPTKVSRIQFIELVGYLISASPDTKFNDQDYKVSGGKVQCVVRISGTNTGTLNLPMLGILSVPATNKHVQLPKETNSFEFKGDKICHMEVEHVPGGGVEGMLTQMGIQIPHHA
jgi:hypothetical protein